MNAIYPYSVLGLETESVSDQDVRNAYLERVRIHPPESDPKRFQTIHAAYEAIQTEQKRLLRRHNLPVPDWADLPATLPETESTPLVPLTAVTRALHQERVANLLKEGSP